MKKTAIIGASGFIGSHLLASYRQKFPDAVGTSCSNPSHGLSFFDLRRSSLADLALEGKGYESVIITSAKAKIQYCEDYPAESAQVNVQGTLRLAEEVGRAGMQCIFLSSDYVFDGISGNYSAEDRTNPQTEYGRQKARVEQTLPQLAEKYLIVRLSKIFGSLRGDGTLLDEMAHSFADSRPVKAAYDQIFCPTSILDLVPALQLIQNSGLNGTFNLCSPESWSRFDIAETLAHKMGVSANLVEKISLHDIPSMARSPLNTSMQCSLPDDQRKRLFAPLEGYLNRAAANWRAK